MRKNYIIIIIITCGNQVHLLQQPQRPAPPSHPHPPVTGNGGGGGSPRSNKLYLLHHPLFNTFISTYMALLGCCMLARTWHSHCDECMCGGGGVAGHQKKRHYLPNLIFIAATIKNCTKFHFQNLIGISELLILCTTILPHDDATRDAATACCQATLVPSPFRDMKSRPQTTTTTTVP